jgi:hypothetical protein
MTATNLHAMRSHLRAVVTGRFDCPSCPIHLACMCCCALSRFVAVERGAVSYPSYPIERTRPVFSSRQQVLDYEQALALAARVDAALEVSACGGGGGV